MGLFGDRGTGSTAFDPGHKRFGRDKTWRSRAREPKLKLDRYAIERGLEFFSAKDTVLVPFLPCFGFAKKGNYNTCRGTFPNGRYGVLGHRWREEKHSVQTGDNSTATTKIQEAHTFVAVIAPETKAPLPAASISASQIDGRAQGLRIDYPPNREDWRLTLSSRADPNAFEAVWRSPAVASFRANYPWGPASGLLGKPDPGGRIEIRAGIVSVWVPGYLEGAELDALTESTSAIADEIAAACSAGVELASFDQPLPPAAGWTQPSPPAAEHFWQAIKGVKLKRVRRGKLDAGDISDPGAQEHERWAAVRDFAHGYASSRGLAVEDGAAFDRSFRSLPFTGFTQFACRGDRPGSSPYRVGVSAMESYLWDSEQAGAAIGGAMFAVAPAPAGTPDSQLQVDRGTGQHSAVAGGLQLVARYVINMDVGFGDLDDLARQLQ